METPRRTFTPVMSIPPVVQLGSILIFLLFTILILLNIDSSRPFPKSIYIHGLVLVLTGALIYYHHRNLWRKHSTISIYKHKITVESHTINRTLELTPSDIAELRLGKIGIFNAILIKYNNTEKLLPKETDYPPAYRLDFLTAIITYVTFRRRRIKASFADIRSSDPKKLQELHRKVWQANEQSNLHSFVMGVFYAEPLPEIYEEMRKVLVPDKKTG